MVIVGANVATKVVATWSDQVAGDRKSLVDDQVVLFSSCCVSRITFRWSRTRGRRCSGPSSKMGKRGGTKHVDQYEAPSPPPASRLGCWGQPAPYLEQCAPHVAPSREGVGVSFSPPRRLALEQLGKLSGGQRTRLVLAEARCHFWETWTFGTR